MSSTLTAEDNQTIRSLTKDVKPSGWLTFSESSGLRSGDLFTSYKSATGLSDDDEMVEIRSWQDEYGYTHKKYQQYYKGIKVEGAEFIEHIKENLVFSTNGILVEQLNIDILPSISFVSAVEIAKNTINANEYAWQNTEIENALKERKNDSDATYFPNGILEISNGGKEPWNTSDFSLVWSFNIIATDPHLSFDFCIDAHSGAILKKEVSGKAVTASATTLFNGVRTFGASIGHDLAGIPFFHLNNEDNGRNIETKDCVNPASWQTIWNKTKNPSPSWGTNDILQTSAHWAAEKAWDYFKNNHSWNGPDNLGGKVRVMATAEIGSARTWNVFGDIFLRFGNDLGSFTGTLDFVGHEYAHTVIEYTKGSSLGVGQPGAIDESLADIFGFLTERSVLGTASNWTIGEDWRTGGERSLSAPSSIVPSNQPFGRTGGCPNTFMGPLWFFGTGDSGGIHINNGVQNKWFNLISVGGTQNGITTQAIGIDKAAKIVFLAMSAYMTSSTNYAQARNAFIAAALEIYGGCSFEVNQVRNAWLACGVGLTDPNPCTICTPSWSNYDIVIPTTWNSTNVPLSGESLGPISIKKGATLTINTPITFAITGEIFIEPGGKLILNSTLTACDRWQGIRIMGDDDNMGVFEGNSGAVIEHAIWGISTTAWGKYLGKSSITCTDMIFRNNGVGAMIATENAVNLGSVEQVATFTDCDFVTDNNLRHEKFWAFVTTYNTYGTKINGCYFLNNQTNSTYPNKYNGGIISLNGSVDVGSSALRQSTFANLYYGIQADRSFGLNHQFDVHNTHFWNCGIGILNSGISNSNIESCTFLLNKPASGLDYPTGVVFQDNINDILFQDNTFLKQGTSESISIGTYVNNIGSYGNVIRRNHYIGVGVGNVANGDNANSANGLYYLCNTNTDNTEKDFTTSTDGHPIRLIQGKPGANSFKPTENTFSGAEWDFDNMSAYSADYYYNKDDDTQKPRDSHYTGLNRISTSPSNHCSDPKRPGILTSGDATLLKEDYDLRFERYQIAKQEFNTAVNSGNSQQIEQKSKALTIEREQMEELASLGFQYALNISHDRASTRQWLLAFHNVTGDFMLVDDYFDNREYSQGLNTLKNIPIKYELTEKQLIDLDNVNYIYEAIADNDGLRSFNEPILKDLETFAESKDGKACFLARTILRNYGKYYPPIIKLDYRSGYNVPEIETEQPNLSKMAVSPNPTDYNVTFNWIEFFSPDKNVRIEILDQIGGLIEVLQPTNGSYSMEWTTENISGSICFYRLLIDGIEVDNGQIIINK